MRLHFSLAAALLIPQLTIAQEPKLDAYGDPLPAGAIARLGTVRLRHSDSVTLAAFQPGGKVLVTLGNDGVLSHWDVAGGKELRRFVLFPDCLNDSLTSGSSAAGPNWGIGHIDSHMPYAVLSDTGNVLVSNMNGAALQVWDTDTGKKRVDIKVPAEGFRRMVLSPDGSLLAAEDGQGGYHSWNTLTGKTLAKPNSSPKIESKWPGTTSCGDMQISPDGKQVAWVGIEQTRPQLGRGKTHTKAFVKFLDAATGVEQSRTETFDCSRDSDSKAIFSPDSKVLAWRRDTSVHLIDTAVHSELRRIDFHEPGVIMAFSPNGKSLITLAPADRVLRVWDIASGREMRRFGEPVKPSQAWARNGTGRGFGLTLSPDSKLAALADENRLRLLDLNTGKEHPANGHSSSVALVQYAADGKTLTSCSIDGTIRALDAATGKELQQTRAVKAGEYFAVSPDGRTLAVAVSDNTVSLRDAATGEELHCVQTPNNPFGTFAFSPDGKTLAALGWENNHLALAFIDVAKGGPGRNIPIAVPPPADGNVSFPQGDAAGLAFSPDGARLAALINWHTLGIWDTVSGREYFRIITPKDRPIQGAVFTPNSYSVALDLAGGLISIHELATGKERRALQIPTKVRTDRLFHQTMDLKFFGADSPALVYSSRPSAGMAYSPNGRFLAQSGSGGSIHLWDIVQRKEIAQLNGHRGYVPTLAFSPDGKTLASGSRDTTVLLWDVSAYAAKSKPEAKAVDVAARWADLLSPNAAKAFDSMCLLAIAPDKSVPFLKKNARPALTPDTAAIQRFIADLDSEEFEVRKKATEELTKLGEAAIPLIRTALQGDVSPEARKRLEALVAKEPRREPTGETLRSIRAIQVLEMIGTTEARSVLEGLANGTPDATVTEAAKAALRRMKR
jgi:WD40 repeat protein